MHFLAEETGLVSLSAFAEAGRTAATGSLIAKRDSSKPEDDPNSDERNPEPVVRLKYGRNEHQGFLPT